MDVLTLMYGMPVIPIPPSKYIKIVWQQEKNLTNIQYLSIL